MHHQYLPKSPPGRQICFDSVHEGTRQIYVVDVGEIIAG
jgi:hypothetical protein